MSDADKQPAKTTSVRTRASKETLVTATDSVAASRSAASGDTLVPSSSEQSQNEENPYSKAGASRLISLIKKGFPDCTLGDEVLHKRATEHCLSQVTTKPTTSKIEEEVKHLRENVLPYYGESDVGSARAEKELWDDLLN